ncbi:DUF1707 SHOCT-like domain-containing protein [Micropruina sp.]|uniref:DUF1707 SHOCT-like domain-containing protein n=1 Tax=Micropruina sp. TaxID=2737536 RepID=UPI0039E5FABA
MSFAEPTDVGPAFGGDLPVSPSDKTRVLALLDAARAEGRITQTEHAERSQAAHLAQTFDDLVPLTRDLVALDAPTAAPAAWSSAPGDPDAGPELIVAIFGGASRTGRWHPRRNLSVLTLFGGTELDLTQAVFTDNVCEINVFCLFGGVEVKVPDGTQVRNEAIAIFGGADTKTVPPVAGGPTVIVKGLVGFGGIEVRGLSKKDR